MASEQLSIISPAGHALAGTLEMPTGLVRGAALFAHCFTCTKQSRAATYIARALARRGIACLRFDFTGLGGSEGDFGRAGFATDVEDLIAAADALHERFADGVLLIGHSLGGAAVLAAASRMEAGRVAAIATVGAPSDIPHVLHNIEGDLETIERDGEGEVTIGGRAFALSRSFIEAAKGARDLLAGVGALRVPLLILHAPEDETVGIEHAGALFDAAKHPKSFISLHGADHLLTRKSDAEFVAGMIATWADRYLPAEDLPALPEEGVVSVTGHGKFGTEVLTASHRFVADEPTSYGGDDSGPTPYDLLNAALGTCTAMTMKMYADRKEWALDGVRVHVTHERNHSEHCDHAKAMKEGERLQALHRAIAIYGDLDEDQRAKLMEIADKCPVHRTLEGELHVHTEAL